MRFLVPLGLLVALAVVGPLLAHLLRRRRPIEKAFPAARLVPTAPPVARRRANVEDRFLLAIRALAVIALALLAASPLVRCSRLSLDRRSGASIALAIVIDDSLSSSAELPEDARRSGARTRFELSIVAARELAASLRPGDATAIVLASAPARVVLAPTQDASAVRATIERLAQERGSDRATDLESALAIASATLAELPQPDRRVVLLSDLADGAGGAPLAMPEGESGKDVVLEAPLDALRAPPPSGASDCAVLAATPEGLGDAIRVQVACALEGGQAGDRAIEIALADAQQTVIGRAALPPTPPPAPSTFDVLVPIEKAKAEAIGGVAPNAGKPTAFARLAGKEPDALANDDLAPVLGAATVPAIAYVVEDAHDDVVATGGAPIVERGLRALETGLPIRPLQMVPEDAKELSTLAGLVVDDPAGLGPEARTALAQWVERGGVLMLALGPRAKSLPLGASFEPFLTRPVGWERVTGPLGVDPAKAGPLGEGVEPPKDLAPKARAILDREDEARMNVRAAWTDGSPLLSQRAIGQGELWIVALPFSPDVSDLALRPAFLALLDAFAARVRDRGAGARLPIGEAWSVGPDDEIEAIPLDAKGERAGPALPVERGPEARRVRPSRIGAYLVTITPKGGETRREVRAVVASPREIDLRPRPLETKSEKTGQSGLQRTEAELGPTLALAIAALAAIELFARLLRLVSTRAEAQEADAS